MQAPEITIPDPEQGVALAEFRRLPGKRLPMLTDLATCDLGEEDDQAKLSPIFSRKHGPPIPQCPLALLR